MGNKPRTRENFPSMKLRGKNRYWKQYAMNYIDDLFMLDLERKVFMQDCRNIGQANAIVKRILLKNLKMPWTLPEESEHSSMGHRTVASGRGHTSDWVMIDEIDWEEPEDPDPTSLSARRWLLTDETETVHQSQVVSREHLELLTNAGIAKKFEEQ